MKSTIIGIFVTVAVFGCSQSQTDETVIDVTAFQKIMDESNEEIVLDVRTPEEFAEGHIPGAVFMNVNDTQFKQKLNKLDKSKTILVYCAAGIRSEKASAILKESGFKEVYHLKDGINAWSGARKELTK